MSALSDIALRTLLAWAAAFGLLGVMMLTERAVLGAFGLGAASSSPVRLLRRGLRRLAMEDAVPGRAHRRLHALAPVGALGAALVAVLALPLPFGPAGEIVALGGPASGVLVLGALAFSILAEIAAGWAGNGKAGTLGSLRSASRLLAGLAPAGLALAGFAAPAGSADLAELVRAQEGSVLGFLPRWGLVTAPFGAVALLGATMILAGRRPFDDAAGRELVDPGLEYGGPLLAALTLASRIRRLVLAALVAVCLFAGTRLPGVGVLELAGRDGAAALVVLLALAPAALSAIVGRGRPAPAALVSSVAFGLAVVVALLFGVDVRTIARACVGLAALALGVALVEVGLGALRAAWPRFGSAGAGAVSSRWLVPLGALQLALSLLFAGGGAS